MVLAATGNENKTTISYPAGNTNVIGTLTVNGGPVPDYVFDPSYKLASIEDQASYMWRNRHLPAVGPARSAPDGSGVIDVFKQSVGMLEELEKAHIYIETLHNEIKTLKSEAAARDARILAAQSEAAASAGEIRAELAALRRRLEK